MSIKSAKKTTFPHANISLWEAEMEKSLNKQQIHALNLKSYEDIELSPIYTKEDLPPYVNDCNLQRLTKSKGDANWKIVNQQPDSTWKEYVEMIEQEDGLETLSFKVSNSSDFSKFNQLEKLEALPLFFTMKSNFDKFVAQLLTLKDKNIRGVFAIDLLSATLIEGQLIKEKGKQWERWQQDIVKLEQGFSNLKTILIDTSPYHQSGANVVQELAVALGEAVFYIEMMKEVGWPPERTIQKLIFHFSISGQFFLEMAKLRAFRILWSTIMNAYQISSNHYNISISAETSFMTKSKLDPYSNMIRASNEAFAAVLGGIDYLQVTPFNINELSPSEFAIRMARNTQLILREETYLNKVIDPAGGAFFVESFTASISEKAWAYFQTIDERGGIYHVLENGWLQQQIIKIANEKKADLRNKKRMMVGVNMFETSQKKINKKHSQHNEEYVRIEPLQPFRFAEEFESGEEK